MKKKVQKAAIMLMAIAVTFTALPLMSSEFSAHAAAAKPAKVTGVAKKAATGNSITIKWKKVAKNVKGYAVYRYDAKTKKWKSIKKVNKAATQYKDSGLKAGTYQYRVKAFNSYKQKLYYNTATKKWQAKKPTAKQWKTKRTKTVTKYMYGPASKTLKVATKKTSTSGAKDTKFNIDLKSGTYDLAIDCYIDFHVKSSGKVKWSSSNTKVAVVEDLDDAGRLWTVKMLSPGTTTITATNWDGQKKSAVIKVVDTYDPDPLKPEDVFKTADAIRIYTNDIEKRGYGLPLENWTEKDIWFIERCAIEAKKTIDTNAKGKELLKQCMNAGKNVISACYKEAGWEYKDINCYTRNNALANMYSYLDLDYETGIVSDYVEKYGAKKIKKIYGEWYDAVTGPRDMHAANIVCIDGQKWYVDATVEIMHLFEE